jgi:hypothetical protein
MRELTGNLWDFHAAGHWVAITTNGYVRTDGKTVMGRGVAKEAAQRFPALPLLLGSTIERLGNVVHPFPAWRLFTFPVKHNWWETADLELIERSAGELVRMMTKEPAELAELYLVRPGCGNGGLLWSNVKPIIAPILDDRFVVVERRP